MLTPAHTHTHTRPSTHTHTLTSYNLHITDRKSQHFHQIHLPEVHDHSSLHRHPQLRVFHMGCIGDGCEAYGLCLNGAKAKLSGMCGTDAQPHCHLHPDLGSRRFFMWKSQATTATPTRTPIFIWTRRKTVPFVSRCGS